MQGSQPTIPDGYKRTEVGVIPEDWNDPQLTDIAEEDSPICYGIVQVGSYTTNGVPVLAIKNLNSDYVSNIHRASFDIERPYRRSRIRPGDILISVKGTTGRIGIVPNGFHGNISRDLARLRLREGIVPSFCFQMLQSNLSQRRLAVAVVGTTRMELSISILKKVRIPLPPTKAEQQAIAEALSDVDALVTSLDRLIAKKRNIKQGTMQLLLRGKKRLAGFSSDWEAKMLGEIAALKNGYAFKSDSYSEKSLFKIITIGNVQDGQLLLDKVNTIPTLPSDIQSHQILNKGDILISMTGNVGRVCIVTAGNCLLNQRVGKLIPMSIEKTFFYFLLRQKSFIDSMIAKAQGGAQGNISVSDILEYEFSLPTEIQEQKAIAQILSDMDAEIEALEKRRGKYKAIKQGMMQELLTGKTRLI